MSKERQFILDFMNGRGWTTTATIGDAAWTHGLRSEVERVSSSSWASRKCLALMRSGWLERSGRVYRLAAPGEAKS